MAQVIIKPTGHYYSSSIANQFMKRTHLGPSNITGRSMASTNLNNSVDQLPKVLGTREQG